MILDTAIMHKHKYLIAGQWGCGAFGNPLEICKIWVEEINIRDISVIFPVYNEFFEDELLKQLKSQADKN